MQVLPGAGRYAQAAGGQVSWAENLRVGSMSVGTYCVPAGGVDPQSPHSEDELYVVISGRGRLTADSGSAEVEPGSVIFVPAGEFHRFEEVTEALTVLVVFAPPEGSAAASS